MNRTQTDQELELDRLTADMIVKVEAYDKARGSSHAHIIKSKLDRSKEVLMVVAYQFGY